VIINITAPVTVHITCVFKNISLLVEQPEILYPLDIYENVLYCFQVRVSRVLHESVCDPHGKCYVEPCASQVPQTTNHTPVGVPIHRFSSFEF
jgi:hypothetical protein